MLSRLRIVIELLHGSQMASLATHSLVVAGYPFASAIPFATDERHRPVFLLSRLAEHTQNLIADARASLLVHGLEQDGEFARATLVGTVRPFDADADLIARFIRYQPAAERFLQLGDFRFYRLEPAQIRVIGGFGQASWLEGEQLTSAASLTAEQEVSAIAALQGMLPAGAELVGLDCFGIDLRRAGVMQRVAFSSASTAEAIVAVARRTLSGL